MNGSDGNLGLDVGVGIVVLEGEVVGGEGIDIADGGVEAHDGERAGVTGELEAGLIEVVRVEVEVAEGVDEVAGFVADHFGHHEGEKSVAGNVEGHAEKEIGAALVELAGEAGAIAGGVVDVELEEEMAGRKGHPVELSDVPCADDMAARVGVAAQGLDEARHLIDGRTMAGLPCPPLLAVNRTEVAAFVRPLVPDGHLVLLEVSGVGLALQEPEKFVDDRAEVELLGGETREAGTKVVSGLPAEDGAGSGPGAVGADLAVVEDVAEEIEVLAHGG